MRGIAGSSPGDRILRKKVIISWYLKSTRGPGQTAAWREIEKFKKRRSSGWVKNVLYHSSHGMFWCFPLQTFETRPKNGCFQNSRYFIISFMIDLLKFKISTMMTRTETNWLIYWCSMMHNCKFHIKFQEFTISGIGQSLIVWVELDQNCGFFVNSIEYLKF